jgi:hypothetical protein
MVSSPDLAPFLPTLTFEGMLGRDRPSSVGRGSGVESLSNGIGAKELVASMLPGANCDTVERNAWGVARNENPSDRQQNGIV